jgi:hypothetical protein
MASRLKITKSAQVPSNVGANTFSMCFVKGTEIETVAGDCPIEHLKCGDRVRTADHGYQPICQIERHTVDLTNPINDHLRPLFLGKLGIAPQHRLLLSCDRLAPANGLRHLADIYRDERATRVVYYSLNLPQHDIIFAGGRSAESQRSYHTKDSPVRETLSTVQARALKHSEATLHQPG